MGCEACGTCKHCTFLNKPNSKKCEMCEPDPVHVPDNVIHKTIVLEPGPLGIEFVTNEPGRNGLILKVTETAQESFREEGITKGWTIIKLDEEEYSHDLLKKKKYGEDCYCMELSCPSQVHREQDNALVDFLNLYRNRNDRNSVAEGQMAVVLESIERFGEFNQQVIDEMQNNYGFSSAQTWKLYEESKTKNQADDSKNVSDKFMDFHLKDNYLDSFGAQNFVDDIDKIDNNDYNDNKIESEGEEEEEEAEEDENGISKIVDTSSKRKRNNNKK